MALILHRTTRQLLLALAASLTISVSADAQTRIDPDRNRFSPAQDVELGRRAAAELRQELPIVSDRRTGNSVARIGARLVAAVPGRLRQPQFRYTFQVVDRKDINAFALPGGPIFVNRGMLEAARSEGEVAGVIAHEISHIALRHGTAQATKGQKFQLGALAGQIVGSMIGGRTGAVVAQGSQIGLGTVLHEVQPGIRAGSGPAWRADHGAGGVRSAPHGQHVPDHCATRRERCARVVERSSESGQSLRSDSPGGGAASRQPFISATVVDFDRGRSLGRA